MVQAIDGSSTSTVLAGVPEPARELPANKLGDVAAAAVPLAGEDQAVEQVVGMFMMQVFMMTNQETEKIRKNTERMINELREEE
jgi:hypothetical protein